MATKTKKKNIRSGPKSIPSPFKFYWEKTNYILFLAGLLIIISGFYFMAQGQWDSYSSLVISPILLFIGFCILMPASILYRKRDAVIEQIDKKDN